jgi:hypothetical protein
MGGVRRSRGGEGNSIIVVCPLLFSDLDRKACQRDKVQQGDTLFILSTECGSRETPEAQAAAISRGDG